MRLDRTGANIFEEKLHKLTKKKLLFSFVQIKDFLYEGDSKKKRCAINLINNSLSSEKK